MKRVVSFQYGYEILIFRRFQLVADDPLYIFSGDTGGRFVGESEGVIFGISVGDIIGSVESKIVYVLVIGLDFSKVRFCVGWIDGILWDGIEGF